MDLARQQYQEFQGLTVLVEQDFGAQPGDLNPLGYKDSIGQPAIEGCGVDSLLAILTDVNVHRIIRRGTTYGAPTSRTRPPNRTTRPPTGCQKVTTGAVVSGPATRPLDVWEVQVTEGSIRIRASARQAGLRGSQSWTPDVRSAHTGGGVAERCPEAADEPGSSPSATSTAPPTGS